MIMLFGLVHVISVGYVLFRRFFVIHHPNHKLLVLRVDQCEDIKHVARIHLKLDTVLIVELLNAPTLLVFFDVAHAYRRCRHALTSN